MAENVQSGLGALAYIAYAEHRKGLTHDGKPMPAWEDLGDGIRGAWEAAAQAVYRQRGRASRDSRLRPGGD